jgi:hypothetical protein
MELEREGHFFCADSARGPDAISFLELGMVDSVEKFFRGMLRVAFLCDAMSGTFVLSLRFTRQIEFLRRQRFFGTGKNQSVVLLVIVPPSDDSPPRRYYEEGSSSFNYRI